MRRGLIGWRKTLVLRRLQNQCFLDPSGYITPVICIYIYIWIKPKFSNTHARFNPMFQVAYDPQKIRNENYLETTVNRLFALRFSPISPFKFNQKKISPFKVLKVGSLQMRWLFFLSSSFSLSISLRSSSSITVKIGESAEALICSKGRTVFSQLFFVLILFSL